MPYVQRPSADIHFESTGARNGPALVLAHGFFMDLTMFARVAPAATAAGVRMICWDARGHGRTRCDGTWDYWDSASDMLAVMDAAGVDHAVVGGLSQGGYAALRAALSAPDRVDGLVLMDTEAAACTVDDVARYRDLFSAWFDAAVPLEPIAAALAPGLIGGTDDDQRPWIAQWLDGDRTRWREAAEALITRDDVVDRLPEIDCPTLVLRGEHDQTCTVEKARLLVDRIPGARPVDTIAGAGHCPAWTHPGEVASVVFDFVTGRLGR